MRVRLLSFLLLISWSLTAQISSENSATGDFSAPNRTRSAESKMFFTVSINGAFPVGSYGKRDIFDPDASFMNVGFEAEASVGRYFFSDIIGFKFSLGVIKNSFSTGEYSRQLNQFTRANVELLEYDGAMQVTGLAGIIVSAPTGQKSALDFSLQFGVAYGIDQESFIATSLSGVVTTQEAKRAKDLAFMPSIGVASRFLLTDKLQLIINLGYRHANFTYTDVEVVTNSAQLDFATYDLPMRNMVIGAGLGFTM